MSTDPEQEFFADGLVDDILTTLSKLSGLNVIARNSSFAFKGRNVDVRQAGKELGARYVLEGSVRKAGNRIRITVQLIDAETGTHVWAERYDRAIEDIFAVQDEITLILATEMQVNLTEGEQARMRYSSTSNVEAWNYWAQGLAHFRTGVVTKDGVGKARACWEKALALDPNSAALQRHDGVHAQHRRALRLVGRPPDRPRQIEAASGARLRARSGQCRRASLRRHGRQPRAPLRRFGRGGAAGGFACARARSTSPRLRRRCSTLAGIHDEAIAHIEKAVRLSPILPANFLGIQGQVYRLRRADRRRDQQRSRLIPSEAPASAMRIWRSSISRRDGPRRRAPRSQNSAPRGRTTRSRVLRPRSFAKTRQGSRRTSRRSARRGCRSRISHGHLSPLWGEGLGEGCLT